MTSWNGEIFERFRDYKQISFSSAELSRCRSQPTKAPTPRETITPFTITELIDTATATRRLARRKGIITTLGTAMPSIATIRHPLQEEKEERFQATLGTRTKTRALARKRFIRIYTTFLMNFFSFVQVHREVERRRWKVGWQQRQLEWIQVQVNCIESRIEIKCWIEISRIKKIENDCMN